MYVPISHYDLSLRVRVFLIITTLLLLALCHPLRNTQVLYRTTRSTDGCITLQRTSFILEIWI